MLDRVTEVEGPFFIVIEGIDGSGKGTQAQYLYDFVKRTYPHLHPILTSEPTKSKFGKLLREYLKEDILEPETLAMLFAADRLHHVCETIVPNLKRGRCVISERYVYSSLIYQSTSGVDPSWLTEINKYAVVPDMMFYLTLPPEEARKRVIARAEKERKYRKGQKKELEFFELKETFTSFHEETAKKFLELVEGNLEVTVNSGETAFPDFGETIKKVIDGMPLAKMVHSHIAEETEKLLLGKYPRITNQYDYSIVPPETHNAFKRETPWLREFTRTRKKPTTVPGVQTKLG